MENPVLGGLAAPVSAAHDSGRSISRPHQQPFVWIVGDRERPCSAQSLLKNDSCKPPEECFENPSLILRMAQLLIIGLLMTLYY